MKYLLILSVFITTSLSDQLVIAQEKQDPGGTMKLEKFQEQVFFSTVRITTIQNKGTSKGASIGSGFLFHVPLNDEKARSVTLLISNRHVFGDPNSPIALNFHKKKTDGSGPELGQTITLQGEEFKKFYKAHPSPEIDLACVNVSLIHSHNTYARTLFPEMLADFSEEDLLPGKEVWFVGYPENRFDTAHNLPLLRRGYIASIPTVDFNSKKQFVIDAQVFPGSSGSPVFAELDQKFKLLGVVTETMIRQGELQSLPTDASPRGEQILGLGIVIKAPLIKELIDDVVKEIKLSLENEDKTTDWPRSSPEAEKTVAQ